MNTDILAISQEGGDWRIDLEDSHVEIQLATSFISSSQALLNLPQEDFERCKASAQADWENLLHRFDIIETGEVDRTFFDHCLYRLFLFPQTFMRLMNQGKPSTWIWLLALSSLVSSLATMVSGIPSAPPSPLCPYHTGTLSPLSRRFPQ